MLHMIMTGYATEILNDYIYKNFITLLILTTIIVLILTNRKNKIAGTGLICFMVFITFIISVAEYIEIWADTYNKDYRILYYKTTLIYWLYPLLTMLLLYITEGVRHKILIAIPLIIDMIVTGLDIFGLGLVYSFRKDHSYVGGTFAYLPFCVETFYTLMLTAYSIRFLKNRKWAKGIVVFFMAGIVLLSQLLSVAANYNLYMPSVAALLILTYYFYMSTIQYNEIHDVLIENEIMLERNKSNLLLAQIRPHFINNSLSVIRSLCFEDPENAVEIIDHLSEYLRDNIKQIDDERLISFDSEMESVDNYLYLEMQRFRGRIEVERNLQFTDFAVPPLSVQTIVENAVRHGISMTGNKGTIWISTNRVEDEIIVVVEDNGMGFDVNAVDFDGVNHIGVKNVKDRVEKLLNGNVVIESKIGEGTRVTIHIPVS